MLPERRAHTCICADRTRTQTRMTHGSSKLRSYTVALLGSWLLLFVDFRPADAQDSSANEVLPILRAIKNATSGGEQSASRTIVCPNDPPNTLTRLLGVICEKNTDCQFLGPEHRCCKGICRKGGEPSIYEPPHGDILGFRRKCPSYTFPERLPIKRCSKDEDCQGLNRICCPDKQDKLLYCRTAAPIWSELPFPENIDTLKTLVGFVQCQAAPPPIIDIFARPCNRTVDCLPNLCCQEGSKKICRPPKRSVLSLAVQATTRLIKG